MAYLSNPAAFNRAQSAWDNMSPPDDDYDEFITQDEIDDARLELAIERQEAEAYYDEREAAQWLLNTR